MPLTIVGHKSFESVTTYRSLTYLLLNLRSPRDYVGRVFVRSRLWYFLSRLDGASVREAHCEQASTAVRRTEAPCAQASTAVREAHCAQATGIYIKICAFSDI